MSDDNKNSPLPLGEGPGVRAAGSGKQANPYVQVVLTYIRHVRSLRIGYLIVGGVVLLLILIASLIIFFSEDSPIGLIILATYLFIYIAVHSKEQFTAPRSHLMPDFRRVHATVAGVAVLILAVLLPLLLTWLAGSFSVGFAALMLSLFGATLWLVLHWAAWWSWILVIWLMVLISKMPSSDLAFLWSGRFEPLAFLLLLVGAVATVLGGIRLMHLNEETWGYPHGMRSAGAMKSQQTGDSEADGPPRPRGLNRWLHDRQMATFARHASRASTSQWSSVCRWQVGMSVGWSCLLMSFGYVLFFFLWFRITSAKPDTMFMFLILSILMPSISQVGTLYQRTHTLVYELLLPVDRGTYLKQLGTAAALSQLQVWLAINIAAILWCLIVVRQPLPIAGVASILIISALFQVFVFGVAVLLSLQDSNVLGLALLIVVAVPLLLAWEFSRPLAEWQYPAMGVMAFFAAFGLLLTYGTYRRWLAVDID